MDKISKFYTRKLLSSYWWNFFYIFKKKIHFSPNNSNNVCDTMRYFQYVSRCELVRYLFVLSIAIEKSIRLTFKFVHSIDARWKEFLNSSIACIRTNKCLACIYVCIWNMFCQVDVCISVCLCIKILL